MSSEANEVKTVSEIQYVKSKIENLTDRTSANAYGLSTLSDGQNVNIQWTVRNGISLDELKAEAIKTIAFYDWLATDQSVKFWDGKKSESGNGATKSEPAGGNSGGKIDWKKPLPANMIPEELADLNEDIYGAEFDYFVIKPDLDDKAVVEFWKDGLEYPVGSKMNKWKYDTIKEALAHLNLETMPDPSKASKNRVAGTQYYVLGNEYKYKDKNGVEKMTRYKNLKLLKPAF